MLSGPGSAEEVAAAVEAAIRAAVEEKGVPLPAGPLDPEAGLVSELGLSSLDLARIVAVLDLELELDPFGRLVAITSVRTAGELTAAYLLAFGGGETEDGGVEEADRRARLRLERASGAARAPDAS